MVADIFTQPTYLKSMSHMWKMHENQCTKYVQSKQYKHERCAWHCSGLFIANFKDVGIENPGEHLQELVAKVVKGKKLGWILNIPLNFE